MQREIVIQGAREHNLKGVDLRLPRGALITMTGVSGSGKSSLAFDTIYQEGQRRFVESLSSYARQFLGQTEKPKVEHIEGLSPTISIDQKTVNRSPRSTVGTVTEIWDHLRLLFARLGSPLCPSCGKPVFPQSAEQIVERVLAERAGRQLTFLAPIVKDRKGEYRKEIEALRMKGYARARIDGVVRRLDEPIELARYERHTIEVVLDRIEVAAAKRARIAEAVENGLRLGDGIVSVLDDEQHDTFSARLSCPECGVSLPEMEPRTFSFNSPHGACPHCDGLGVADSVDPGLVVPYPDKTIDGGAIAPMSGPSF
jgi:excinuclease ABC subunit A